MHRPQQRRSHHYPELDSLRGIAALIVVLDHFARLWDTSGIGFIGEMLQGTASGAVVIFFILSGFVLTLPYTRRRERPFRVFVLRRIARIYLPYLAALGFALLGFWKLGGALPVSTWFNQTWTAPLTRGLVLGNIFLIGVYDTAQANTAFWSLAVEMRLSLIFPPLCLMLLRTRRNLAISALVFVVMLDLAAPHFAQHRLDRVAYSNLTDTLLGLVCFAVGILMAREIELIRKAWDRAPYWLRVVFFCVSALLVGFANNLGRFHGIGLLQDILQVLGGCGVIISVHLAHTFMVYLNRRLPARLGQVSYSLYLVHGTVLFALVHLCYGHLTRIQMLVPFLVLTFAATLLFYVVFEKPSIALSRSIG